MSHLIQIIAFFSHTYFENIYFLNFIYLFENWESLIKTWNVFNIFVILSQTFYLKKGKENEHIDYLKENRYINLKEALNIFLKIKRKIGKISKDQLF